MESSRAHQAATPKRRVRRRRAYEAYFSGSNSPRPSLDVHGRLLGRPHRGRSTTGREPQSTTRSWRVYARISMVRQSSQPAHRYSMFSNGLKNNEVRRQSPLHHAPRLCPRRGRRPPLSAPLGAGHNSEGPCASSHGHCTTCATLPTVPHDGNVAKDQVARLLKVPVQAQPGPNVLLSHTRTLLKSSFIPNVRRVCAFFFGCVRSGQLLFLQVCSASVRRAKTSSSLGLCTIGSTLHWKPKFSGTTPKAGAARNAGVRKVKVRRESANDR